MEDLNNKATDDTLEFDYPTVTEETKNIIKVVGVGGGGSNAVENMYKEGIQDVSFLIVNTDKAALQKSLIPHKLQISKEGLGAGAQPDRAERYATEYEDAIRNALSDGTKMVFITAGMGGGTGTGASPVVAKISHELGILTIGIVTIPFQFEGMKKIQMALEGVASIRQYVDALLVVNNNRLIEVYPDLNFFNAFKKADDTLTIAARSISDIINKTGYMNLDFADVEKTLKGSGVALISTGEAMGEGRVTQAIGNAVSSPLLQDNDISKAKRLLFELCFSESNPVSMAEIGELTSFVESLSSDIDVIWGSMVDNSLGDNVRMIVLASGFEITKDGDIVGRKVKLRAEKEEEERRAQEEAERLAREEEERKQQEETEQKAREEEERKRQEEADRLAEEKRQADILKAQEDEAAAQAAAEIQRLEEELRQQREAARQAEADRLAREAAAKAAAEAQAAAEREANKSALGGIEQIRAFYGEEFANSKILDQVRKNYYLLDNPDLSNEQLVALLETMPAYNRTSEQLSQLKTVAQSGAQSIQAQSEMDGTIHF